MPVAWQSRWVACKVTTCQIVVLLLFKLYNMYNEEGCALCIGVVTPCHPTPPPHHHHPSLPQQPVYSAYAMHAHRQLTVVQFLVILRAEGGGGARNKDTLCFKIMSIEIDSYTSGLIRKVFIQGRYSIEEMSAKFAHPHTVGVLSNFLQRLLLH
jgi:hypothetical protein